MAGPDIAPDTTQLTDEERVQGWAIRKHQRSDGPALVLYQAAEMDGPCVPEHFAFSKLAYYHCHLPYELENLLGLVVVLLKYTSNQRRADLH